MKVLIDTTPLNNSNAIRGVGTYTRFLTAALEKNNKVEVARSGIIEAKGKTFSPDIVHYPFFDLFFPTLPIFRKAKTVVTIHDVIPLLYPKFYPRGKRGELALIRQKLALKNVDLVITDSEASKKDITKYLKVSSEKIEVVPLAANPELKKADSKAIAKYRRQFKLPKKYLLYVGDINYNKNLPQLIKTLKYLPSDIKLVCLGKNFFPQDIPEWQWIDSQLALSGVSKRVKFLTNVLGDDYEALSAIYTAALAYIQPSLYEGFGLPILEAMQCQTPVICGQNSSLVEVSGYKALLVNEETAANFSTRIEEILAWTKTKRNKFVQEAYKWSKEFTWKKTAKKTVDAYQKILKK